MTRGNEPIHWVLLDETGGAACQNGETLSPAVVQKIAEVVTLQLARDWGSDSSARAGSSPTDIMPGERVYTFKNGLPEAPGAIAYHSIDGSGVEFGMEDITSCSSLYGNAGAASAFSHEALETEGDRGCNGYSDDFQGTLHANERCDAVEVQGYEIDAGDGTKVTVSNFLLDAWFIPGAAGPYTFMGANRLPGFVEPTAPMTVAAGNGGNYDSIEPAPASGSQVFGFKAQHTDSAGKHMNGRPRDMAKAAHWSSRTYKRGHRLRAA